MREGTVLRVSVCVVVAMTTAILVCGGGPSASQEYSTRKGSPSFSSISSTFIRGWNAWRSSDEDTVNYKKYEGGMRECSTKGFGYVSDERCDGVVHCPNASDELHCPCYKRIPQQYWCDGYYDCPDFSDELACGECGETDLVCEKNQTSHCVPLRKVCNGVRDCDDRKDETYCFRLKKIPGEVSKGYGEARQGVLWFPLCAHREQNLTRFVRKFCNQVVGRDREKGDRYELQAVNRTEKVIQWAHIHRNRIHLSSTCRGYDVMISCGSVYCDNSLRKKKFPVEERERRNRRDDLDQEGLEEEEEEEEEEERGRDKRDHGATFDQRIVGGSSSSAFVWNFLVLIKRNGYFYCSGTLLTPYWVLTAAHTIYEPESAIYEAHAGLLRRDSWSPYEQTSLITTIVKHEHYNDQYIWNDLALFRLDTPMQINRWVRPVCLATEVWPEEGDICTVAGWGNLDEDGEDSMELQQVNLPIVRSCQSETFISDYEVICAGYPQGQKDACQGDSGGPLMCTSSEEGWVQTGVVSFGRGCARPGHPGVYVRVTHHLQWIYNKLEELSDPSNFPSEGQPISECWGKTCLLAEGSCLLFDHICDNQVDCLNAEDELCPEIDDPKPSYESYRSTTIDTTSTTTQGQKSDTTTTTTTTTAPPPTTTTTAFLKFPTSDISPGVEESCELPPLPKINETLNCGDNFLCTKIPECVSWQRVCDGAPHCVDGTDELDCSCTDRLHTLGFDNFTCDGIYDCHDLSDEECQPCEAHFVCPMSRQCVLREEVCDGEKTCKLGEDELHCMALINIGSSPAIDRYGELLSQEEGRLVLRVEGVWDTICVNTISRSIGERVCSILGYGALEDLYYVEDSMYITSPLISRKPKEHRSKLHRPLTINLQNTHSHREIRSVDEFELLNATTEDSSTMKILRKSRTSGVPGVNARTEKCRQVVLKCSHEKCGKVPLYFFSKVTPVWKIGGFPWAAGVYVNGEYRCGGTLIHPLWILTSYTCMEGVRVNEDSVWAVMGSVWRVGSPIRMWSGYEEQRQVGAVRQVKGSDILLLKLIKRMPKTDHITHLCLPSEEVSNLGPQSRCAMAGLNLENYRESQGVPFSSSRDCPPHHICPQVTGRFKSICMESWAGVMACQSSRGNNPTWSGVGVWSYRRSDGECDPATIHPTFTNQELKELHRIMEDKEIVMNPEVCEGRYCATGVCVTPSMECDGRVNCPDASDETCPSLIPRCRTLDANGNCECPPGWWTCHDFTCIPGSALCNGVSNCKYGEDELDCSCCKVLLFWWPDKRCDGVLDCPDQTDEMNCGCQGFRCFSSTPQTCVSEDKVCDENKDCPGGEDEAACVALTPHLRMKKDALGKPKSYDRGFLLVRVSGKWFTYDYDSWKSYLSHLICLQLGYSQAKETSKKEMTEDRMMRAIHGEDVREQEGVDHLHGHGYEGKILKMVWIECMEEEEEEEEEEE